MLELIDVGPFEVAFVKTTYTVDESVGSVSVCVNLTHPEIDILDETVNVFVIDNTNSIYIPAGAPFASKVHALEASVLILILVLQLQIYQIFSVDIQ